MNQNYCSSEPQKPTTSKKPGRGHFSTPPHGLVARIASDCPLCRAPLQLRRRRKDRHEFLGCVRYPACDFTEPVDSALSDAARVIRHLQDQLKEALAS